MRKIDWDGPLTEGDIQWIRQAGFMSEDRIAAHQAQFEADVPEDQVPEDTLTKDALDPTVRVVNPLPEIGNGSPVLVDPVVVEDPEDDKVEGDDYDQWKVSELEDEVKARNALAKTTEVTVVGTGKGGAVTKPDMIKGLRLWDDENPGAL